MQKENPIESNKNPKNSNFLKNQVKKLPEKPKDGNKSRELSKQRLEENKAANLQKKSKK